MKPICAILHDKADLDRALSVAVFQHGLLADYIEWDGYFVFRVWPAISLPRFPFN